MTPRSTVRLQLNPGFTLEQAAEHLPYYASLGVSHLYLSPISCARKDSMHGYDVIDHSRVDPRLGGEEALNALVQEVHQRNMGLILDIVPNHMAAHPDNPWWYSVLLEGPASPFARWFDIQWDRPGLRDKLLLPILGNMYGLALERGDIRLVHDGTRYALDVHGLRLPLAVGSLDVITIDVEAQLDAHDPSTRHGRRVLHELLQRQHYRLTWWQCAADQINWRRFFEISDLAGLRVECDEVFEAVHALPLRLFEQGWVDGLRIDHVDGLAYPLAYCERLHQALQERVPQRPEARRDEGPWLLVEKILAHGEILDSRWKVDGTTGYDFMDAVSRVMHDPASEAALDRYWGQIARDDRGLDDWRREARALMLTRHFPSERDVLLDKLLVLAGMGLASRDASRRSLGRALDAILIEFSVYRTYLTLSQGSDTDLRYLDQARDGARRSLLASRDLAALSVLDFITDALKGRNKSAPHRPDQDPSVHIGKKTLPADILQRFQQLTPPLAAKALEDTVFYRYGRLLSRNDVGSDPGVFSTAVTEFHRWNKWRAASEPRAMNATATHDHKRGEDVRARLAVISELPHVWEGFSTRCLEALGQQATIDCGDPAGHCYMLLQTVIGAWPPELQAHDEQGMNAYIERLQQWQAKALREAKQRTSWFYPDESYEQEQADRIEFMLCNAGSALCRTIADFVNRVETAGVVNSLSTVVLRCTLPGVPDLYQGTDLWDFSLVDPDNRKQVDVEKRVAMLRALNDQGKAPSQLLSDWRSGAIKQAVLTRCLQVRAQHPDVFTAGHYTPVATDGPLAGHVMAFSRSLGDVTIMVVVTRLAWQAVQHAGQRLALPLIPPDVWRDTCIALPINGRHGEWVDILSGDRHRITSDSMQVKALLGRLPVAVLLSS